MTQAGDDRGRTVLLVDDEPSVLTMARLVLEPRGYTVLGAFAGAEALELFAERHEEIDVAVLDYMLPDMVGNELLQEMSEIDDTVRLIIATGYSDEEIAEEARASAAGFIRKPFDLQSLAAKIEEVLPKVRN